MPGDMSPRPPNPMPSERATNDVRRKLAEQVELRKNLDDSHKDLYRLVYEICKQEGASTYGLASALGMSSSTVQRWYREGKKLAEGG